MAKLDKRKGSASPKGVGKAADGIRMSAYLKTWVRPFGSRNNKN